MAEQSLLTDEVRGYIGRASEPSTVRITEDAVRRATDAYSGDPNRPLEDGKPVPGYVLVGLVPDSDTRVPDLMPKSLLVSNEFSIERPILFGEELTGQSRIADINERLGGQFGHGLYVRSEIEFRDGSGSVVGRTASTLMYYDPAGARRREGEE
jgi:hypothetical protein